MPEIVVTQGQNGKLTGVSEEDKKAFALFCKRVNSLEPGQTLAFAWEVPRSPAVHGAYFAAMTALFEQQDRFTTVEALREWAERGAGHVDTAEVSGPGLDAPLIVERVRSIRYDTLDDDAFRLLFRRVTAFLLSEAALRHLWPAAKVGAAYQGMLAILEGGAR